MAFECKDATHLNSGELLLDGINEILTKDVNGQVEAIGVNCC